jgi:uncharacterized integral membrane protein
MSADEKGAPATTAPPQESPGRGERAKRQGRSAGLYAGALLAVVLVGILVAWVVANRGRVEVDWLVGSTDAALALVIFVAAALGWVLGIATAVLIRRRASRPGSRHPG